MGLNDTGAKWDGPVELVLQAKIGRLKKEIRRELREGPLRRSIRAAMSSFGTGDVIEIWSSLPYSEIQDQGGAIPPFAMPVGQRKMVRKGYGQRLSRKRYGRVMVFEKGGKTIFARKRRGFYIRPKNYVQKGVSAWSPHVKFRWKRVKSEKTVQPE